MTLPPPLEPVTPDPRKLRRTAYILVAIMIIGGGLVLRSYNQWAENKAKDDRPAFVWRLSDHPDRDLHLVRQDGSEAGLLQLMGTVSVIHTTVREAHHDRTAAVMRRLRDHYADNPEVSLVSLVLDPAPGDAAVDSLAETAAEMGAQLPRWWVATTADPTVLRKFLSLKDLRPEVVPHQVEGRWIYDPSVTLIDRNRHVRRGVVPQVRGGPQYTANFNFDQAADWDSKKILTGTERSNVEELERLLIKTIDQLLAEKRKTP
jgi:hypothetical protein